MLAADGATDTMTQTILELLFSWAPFLLLIVIWLYLMRRSGALSQRSFMDAANKRSEEQLSELKRLNEKLDRIAALLEASRNDK